MISLAEIIETQLVERPAEMAGLFCGLVAGSIVAACRMFEWRHAGRLAFSTAAAVGDFRRFGAPRPHRVSAPSLLMLFGAGAVASCAMILPGISGGVRAADTGNVRRRDQRDQ